jgi:hypothetical protein
MPTHIVLLIATPRIHGRGEEYRRAGVIGACNVSHAECCRALSFEPEAEQESKGTCLNADMALPPYGTNPRTTKGFVTMADLAI